VKSLSRIILPLALIAFAPAKVLACVTCYGGNIDSPMADGMNWGIFTLLGVVGTVLAAFLTFLIYAIRKSEAMNAAAELKKSEASNV
jgi:hypothetical protein